MILAKFNMCNMFHRLPYFKADLHSSLPSNPKVVYGLVKII